MTGTEPGPGRAIPATSVFGANTCTQGGGPPCIFTLGKALGTVLDCQLVRAQVVVRRIPEGSERGRDPLQRCAGFGGGLVQLHHHVPWRRHWCGYCMQAQSSAMSAKAGCRAWLAGCGGVGIARWKGCALCMSTYAAIKYAALARRYAWLPVQWQIFFPCVAGDCDPYAESGSSVPHDHHQLHVP